MRADKECLPVPGILGYKQQSFADAVGELYITPEARLGTCPWRGFRRILLCYTYCHI